MASSGHAEPVLLVTGRRATIDAVSPVAAAVGLDLEVRADPEVAGQLWLGCPLVLLGDDAAVRGVPVRRPGLVLVSTGSAPDRFFRAALELGAEFAAVLPDDQEWLLQRLLGVAEPALQTGVVIAVVGGRGGAGTSTLATCLAVTAARERTTLLVDGDPQGAGVDALLDSTGAGGLRWPDLSGLRGPLRGASLRDALPVADGCSVLSWGSEPSSDLQPGAVESVLQAARRCFDLVVADLPRSPSPAALAVASHADVLVLLVPSEVQATLAATRVLTWVRPLVADIRLVVRGPSPAGLRAGEVADAVGLPLDAALPAEPRVAIALERGELPASRGPLRRYCRQLLGTLAAGEHGRTRDHRQAEAWSALGTPA